MAAFFDASVGHVFDAPSGRLVDEHASHFELLEGAPCPREIPGEQARLKTVPRGIDEGEGLFEKVVGGEIQDGCEGFFRPQRMIERHVLEEGGLEPSPLGGAAAQHSCSVGDRILKGLEGALHCGGIDHGADEHLGIQWIPALDGLADGPQKAFAKGRVNFAVDQHVLDADAGLPGVRVGPGGDCRGGAVDVGVGVDDGSGVSPEFKGPSFVGGEGLKGSAHGGAAGERDHGEGRILNEGGHGLVGAGDHVEESGRQACGLGDLGEEEGGEGGSGGGFENQWAAAGDCRGEFVGHEVEWEIKRGECGDGADGEAETDAVVPVPCGSGSQIQP